MKIKIAIVTTSNGGVAADVWHEREREKPNWGFLEYKACTRCERNGEEPLPAFRRSIATVDVPTPESLALATVMEVKDA